MFLTVSCMHMSHLCGAAAKPKVADYPFTTLVPNLGVCEMNYRTTVFADIPGQCIQPPLACKTLSCLIQCAF